MRPFFWRVPAIKRKVTSKEDVEMFEMRPVFVVAPFAESCQPPRMAIVEAVFAGG